MQFFTIASGSSGNAYFLELAGQHFLIDAGVSGKRIEHALQKKNIRGLNGIFITHEHNDHIAGAGVIARRFKTEIYATPLTWRYFLRHKKLGALNEEQIKIIEPDKPLLIGGAEVTAFDIPHDASQPVGYSFRAVTNESEKMVIATDLGHATESVKERLKNARVLLIESNHDPEMLERGRYQRELKTRVAGNRGHLSNAQAGMLLAEVVIPGKTHVFLAHLSEENNTPMLAFDTVARILDGNNITVGRLEVAERNIPGEPVVC
ncbi:MAG: MBL fold metallo-hydrolase [Clostridiales bacterium]|jgi:phosphoribosyl 1,2-cyclic phosphodiesterase|nr:MBL fold metallo-hydrolase [Clostridiales bacterium]